MRRGGANAPPLRFSDPGRIRSGAQQARRTHVGQQFVELGHHIGRTRRVSYRCSRRDGACRPSGPGGAGRTRCAGCTGSAGGACRTGCTGRAGRPRGAGQALRADGARCAGGACRPGGPGGASGAGGADRAGRTRNSLRPHGARGARNRAAWACGRAGGAAAGLAAAASYVGASLGRHTELWHKIYPFLRESLKWQSCISAVSLRSILCDRFRQCAPGPGRIPYIHRRRFLRRPASSARLRNIRGPAFPAFRFCFSAMRSAPCSTHRQMAAHRTGGRTAEAMKKGRAAENSRAANLHPSVYSTSDGAAYTRDCNSLLSIYNPLASEPNSSILVIRSAVFFSSSPCSLTNQSRNCTVR